MQSGKVRGSLRPPRAPGIALSKRLFTSSLAGLKQQLLKSDFSLAPRLSADSCKSSSSSSEEDCGAALSHLDDPGFSADFTTYTSLLRFCRKAEDLRHGKRVHRHIVKRGLQHDLSLVSLLVLMYTDCGALESAHDVFISLVEHDQFVFTVILRAYARLDLPNRAFQTFEQMHQEGFLPNSRIFISIFAACSTQAAFLEGKRMHTRFLGTMSCADLATTTALLTMYIKCSNSEYTRWIFDNMEELDAVVWNVMIACCLQHRQVGDALALFNFMQQQGFMPSKVTIIHVLEACCSECALGKGLQLHCSIMGSEVESNIMVQTALINMYGSCGGVGYAERVFSKMAIRDEVVWSAMVAVYTQNAQVRSASQLFERMLQEGMVSNKYILSSILSGCAIQLVAADGKQMHARITCSGLPLDGAVGNALVNFYGKVGCLKDTLKAFHRTMEHDMVSWNAIIAACAEHGHLECACQMYNQIYQEGSLADKATFVNVLSACANRAALFGGKVIHSCMASTDLELDLTLDNALMNMYGKCGQLDVMHAIFEKMPVKNSVSWNIVIGVYVQHGRGKEALWLFEEMQGVGIAPDRVTFTSVLSVCASQGALAEGKRIHDLFKRQGFRLDQVVGSALVSLYGKCGSLKEAREVFDDMPECDVIIWNALITSFSQNGHGEQALELFGLMQQQLINPTYVTFISVLSACSHVGLVDEAWLHFTSMQLSYGIEPVVDHYNCMLDLLGRAGRLEEAEKLLHAMSMEPTVASLMTLLGACRLELDYRRGKRVAEKVFRLDPASPSPYVMLSNIYAQAGMQDDAINVMKMMRDKHIDVDEEETEDCIGYYFDTEEMHAWHILEIVSKRAVP